MFRLYSRVPIIMPVLLTQLIKVGQFCYDQRLIPFSYIAISNLNLDLLDLENLDDEECIDALNYCIFS